MNDKLRKKVAGAAVLLSVVVLAGCGRAPAFNILGSYFPAWLFSLFAGIVLTIAAGVVLRRKSLGEALNPPLLMYPCLTALFTFSIWLIFFRT